MTSVKIKVDDRVDIEISHEDRIIIIKGYSDKCIMTINYPDNWAISRAIQHAMTIAQSSINSSIQ